MIHSLPGRATAEGTAGFAERHPEAALGHFRQAAAGWTLSSLGLGTYLGSEDGATDAGYGAALSVAADMGCNVIDTAIVYRHQRSERAIGTALAALVAEEVVHREEVVVATKAGFLPYDSGYDGSPAEYVTETLIRPGIITADDIVGGAHCMTPGFLRAQLATSRRNLGCDVVDIHYLHNPESQLSEVDRPEFLRRIRDAFEALEEAVRDGEITVYGTATWTGYRVAPEAPDFLELADLVDCAVAAGGPDHHFRAIQLPLNLAMPEAAAVRNQTVDGERVTLLEAAARRGLTVMASASLMQSRLVGAMGEELRARLGAGATTDAQRAIQFVRSAPGLTTALVGMANPGHAVENCSIATVPSLGPDTFQALFRGP